MRLAKKCRLGEKRVKLGIFAIVMPIGGGRTYPSLEEGFTATGDEKRGLQKRTRWTHQTRVAFHRTTQNRLKRRRVAAGEKKEESCCCCLFTKHGNLTIARHHRHHDHWPRKRGDIGAMSRKLKF